MMPLPKTWFTSQPTWHFRVLRYPLYLFGCSDENFSVYISFLIIALSIWHPYCYCDTSFYCIKGVVSASILTYAGWGPQHFDCAGVHRPFGQGTVCDLRLLFLKTSYCASNVCEQSTRRVSIRTSRRGDMTRQSPERDIKRLYVIRQQPFFRCETENLCMGNP